MKKEKYSVLMSVYKSDNAEHFDRALCSITEEQSVKPDEIVLVVDGPVYGELSQIIESYNNNPLFKVIQLEKNMGHGEARRTGLNNCSHNLVALMDADDISFPDRFEKQIKQ